MTLESNREPLVLASGSARRATLLRAAGLRFRVLVPKIAERPHALTPSAARARAQGSGGAVERVGRSAQALALHKALWAAARTAAPCWILAADTMGIAPDCASLFGKPAHREAARVMLERLCGRWHEVVTGYVLLHAGDGRWIGGYERSRVRLRALDARALERYLASERWRGKAGGYGAQDRPGLVEAIEGSVSNVIGLPMEAIERWLRPGQNGPVR